MSKLAPKSKNENASYIGIVGWWKNLNYGACLTYYALYRVLEKLGYKPLMIDYKPTLDKNNVAYQFGKSYYRISKEYTDSTISDANDHCWCFISGSDQLFNPVLENSSGPNYWLSFVKKDKIKISMASSFGNNVSIPENFIDRYKGLLKGIDYLSVREDYAKNISEEQFGVPAEFVCDPVFMCDISTYDQLAEKSEVSGVGRVVCFFLDPTPEKINAALTVSNKLEKNPIFLTDMHNGLNKSLNFGNYDKHPLCKVEDFVKYFKTADYILTDSFHGTCFSIIFNKQFMSFANKLRGADRFQSLVRTFGLSSRLLFNLETSTILSLLNQPVNYEIPNELVNSLSKKTLLWLENALSADKKYNSIAYCLDLEEKCTGCSSCENICPVDAISLKENINGFLNPVISFNQCTNCGLCVKHCPVVNCKYDSLYEPECYAACAEDSIRKISSSGGAFYVLSKKVLDEGGYIAGAKYDTDYGVIHGITNSPEELCQFHGSKYYQSKLDKLFREIKERLSAGDRVLFSGTPCQNAGLKAFLGEDYSNLLLVEVICHGISSKKVFDKYHQDILNSKPLTNLFFKSKEPWGWHAGINAFFADGTKYQKPCETDPFYVMYLGGVSKNQCCGACNFNKLPRQADITIGDFWGIDKYNPNLNDGMGTSVILINSEKGKRILDQVSDEFKVLTPVPMQYAIAGNKPIVASHQLSGFRKEFFKTIDTVEFRDLVKAYNEFQSAKHDNFSSKEGLFYAMAKTIAERINGRKLVMWADSPILEAILKKDYNIVPSLYVTIYPHKINSKIHDICEISGRSSEFYLVGVPQNYSIQFEERMHEYGFEHVKDYLLRGIRPISISNYDLSSGPYVDDYGNFISGKGIIKTISISGYNNRVEFDKTVVGLENVVLKLSNNSRIQVGGGVNFSRKDTTIEILGTYLGFSIIKIDKNCRFNSSFFRMFNHYPPSKIIIGSDCSFENNLGLHANTGKGIIIGSDCMFSYDVEVFSGDGHSIMDVATCENINGFKSSTNKSIILGDHIWVGFRSTILSKAIIGSGSIIGVGSVVNGKYSNNCTIAGNPARVIRSNICWNRATEVTGKENCSPYNYHTMPHHPLIERKILIVGEDNSLTDKLLKMLRTYSNSVTLISSQGYSNKINDIKYISWSKGSLHNGDIASTYFDVLINLVPLTMGQIKELTNVVSCKKCIHLSSPRIYLKPDDLTKQICEFDKCDPDSEEYHVEDYLLKCWDNKTTFLRVPSTIQTLQYYLDKITNTLPINCPERATFSVIREGDLVNLLMDLSVSDFTGVLNYASIQDVSVSKLLDYLCRYSIKEQKLKIDICDPAGYSLSIDNAVNLGYIPTNLDDWFWEYVDNYLKKNNLI